MLVALVVALSGLTTSCAPGSRTVSPAPVPVRGGFDLLVTGEGPQDSVRVPPLLDRLVSLGSTSIAVAFPVYQDGATATDVHVGGGTPPAARLERLIQMAHERGLRVMLRPLIDQTSLTPTGDWRGSLRPASVERWFDSYLGLLLGYARLGAQTHTEVLDIGTELTSLEPWNAQWMRIISSLRTVYPGQLTYSMNWDGTPHAFWQALDFIGVDAYFPLTAPDHASVTDLQAAWQPWLDGLRSRAAGKQLVVTEVGVLPLTNGFRDPWRWEMTGPPDYEAQARYYRSACDAARSLGATALYWWDVRPDTVDDGFDPLGRPAEQQVGDCFHGSRTGGRAS